MSQIHGKISAESCFGETMTTRRQFFTYSGLGVISTLLASCFGGQKANSNEIEFWTMQLQPKFTKYFNDAIGQFEQANPGLKVKWVDVPWDGMEKKILAAMQAKTAPDVVNLNPDFASQLAAKNAWLELDEKNTGEAKKEYLPGMWKANSLSDKTFGLPWYITTNITIYNQELLKKAGIAQPPKTYQELAQAAKQIKEKTGKYAFFATLLAEDANDVLESLVQMGVELVNPSGKAAFNSPQGKIAFQYWVDLFKQGLLPKEVMSQGQKQGIQLYEAGETAMLFGGAPLVNDIAKNAPLIAKVSAIAPQITGQTKKIGVAVMNLVIPRTTKNAPAAVKFALFVTNAVNQLAFANSSDTLPSQIKAVADYKKALQAKKEASISLAQGKIISASQLDRAEVLIPPIKDLGVLKKAVYEALQAAMTGDKSIEQALQGAADAWDSRSTDQPQPEVAEPEKPKEPVKSTDQPQPEVAEPEKPKEPVK
jgi:putative chitobiose transport system substrate-binding protein